MSNKKDGVIGVIIYLCLLLMMVIVKIINDFDILSVIYFITLVGCFCKYLMISKE